MFRQTLCVWIAVSMLLHHQVQASEFGYSIDINFGAELGRIDGPAGNDDRVSWNNVVGPRSDFVTVDLDIFGDRGQSPVQVGWRATDVQPSINNEARDKNDIALMGGFLASPATIELRNLDKVIPFFDGPVTYALTVYTYGGQEGKTGTIQVGRRQQSHIDSGQFTGDYTTGIQGNTIVFEGLNLPDLLIQTDDWMPINAMSLSYCKSGDFNNDGKVDATDLNKLSEAVKGNDSSEGFDVNFDLVVDNRDVRTWIECSKGTCVGDVNLDGVFNSADLILLFQTSEYESGKPATWVTGDWNGDCKFDSSDLLLAFQEGCYDAESSHVLASVVPEPNGLVPTLMSCLGWALCRRKRRTS